MTHKRHQIKRGFPAGHSAGDARGSLYLGVIICLHHFFAKEVIFENKTQLSAGICVCEGQQERDAAYP